jgi:hypothetical protein
MSRNSLYHIFIFLLILNNFSFIFAAYPKNYTFPLLYTVRIGSQSTEIKLLLNSFSANNILFTNSNRNYYKQISEGRKSDAFLDKLEFNGQIIPDFPFTLLLDNTGLNSPEIQGEFGLGIDKDNINDLVENLFFNQIISNKKLILETSKDLKSVNIQLNTESVISEFKFCNLTRKTDLDNAYSEAWICDLSHIIEIEDNTVKSNVESIFENANPIDARAVFDTRQKNIILPTKYLEILKAFFELKNCKTITDKSLEEKYLQCDKDNIIPKTKSLYFIIDGYGIIFNMDELFEDDGKFKNSIIRFSNSLSKSNLFVFGMPLFKKYSIMFDYDNKVIGLKGDNIYDFSNVYKKWMEQKSVVKITTKGAQKEDEGSLKEKLVLVGGICLGIFIILGVWFYNKRRNLDNKLHSELIEENKTLPDNNNLNELEIAKKL